MHVETEVIENNHQRVVTAYLEWVKQLLPYDKYLTFLNLFTFPLFTNEITEKIYNQLERVFEPKNPFFNYNFTNPELKIDWAEYRESNLKEFRTWRTKGWQAYKTRINSVLIVDLPQEQEGSRPEPYFYWLDISCVKSYELKDDWENFEYIIFEYDIEKKQIAVFCDKYYRIVTMEGGKIKSIDWEVEHNLNYVPAKFFWTTPLKSSEPDLKRSDLSNQLSQLDELLFKVTSKKHLDLYAAYPIFSAYSADCDYEMMTTIGETAYQDVCVDGFIKRDGNYVIAGQGIMKCPKCSESRLNGAGSFIEVRPPSEENNFKDMREPVSITSVDRSSLDYNVEEIDRLINYIIVSVTGSGGEPKNDQAKNEKQIIAGFEEKTTILRRIAWNFQNAHKFVNDTIAKLRYDNAYLGSDISWGTDFYAFSTQELRSLYKNAKENGLAMAELDMLQKQIITTEHKNNPSELKRALILADLEPFKHFTLDELLILDEKGLITDQEELQLKLNFSNFIERFERENTDIVNFGKLLDYDKKIQNLKKELKSYGGKRIYRASV